MLSIYGRCSWKLAEIFFAKDRTAPEANCFKVARLDFLRGIPPKFEH